jgi:hypothetical protein
VYLRPSFNHIPVLKILLGCLPNFLAAFIISVALIVPVLIRKIRHGRWLAYTGSAAVLIIFTIEEFKPFWGASESFDPYDILASVVGSFLAILTYEMFNRKQGNIPVEP